jgi:hypothetical protein
MPILQSSLNEIEVLNDGVAPPWEEQRERHWDELSDIEKASRVAKRLLGPPKIAAGTYISVHATENMWTGDLVTLDTNSNAKKWDGFGFPSGVAICPLGEGMFGWIQTTS